MEVLVRLIKQNALQCFFGYWIILKVLVDGETSLDGFPSVEDFFITLFKSWIRIPRNPNWNWLYVIFWEHFLLVHFLDYDNLKTNSIYYRVAWKSRLNLFSFQLSTLKNVKWIWIVRIFWQRNISSIIPYLRSYPTVFSNAKVCHV